MKAEGTSYHRDVALSNRLGPAYYLPAISPVSPPTKVWALPCGYPIIVSVALVRLAFSNA